MRVKDLSGRRFGKLTVFLFGEVRNGHAYWLCKCDCGGTCYVRGSHLICGNVSSCGCSKGNITHGESKTRLYNIWAGMRDRCTNQNSQAYASYGARGIKICPEWDDYKSFRDWALANGYSEDLTIDRINNDDGYSPKNCRWATALQQASNTRKTRLITYNGETHTKSEWARVLNMNQSTLSMRLNKYGWSVNDALGKEVRNYGS